MPLQSRTCPQCGASVPRRASQCPYCGAHFEHALEADAAPPADFGWGGWAPLAIGAVGAVALYAAGWAHEDTRYWLASEAVALWVGGVPAWLFAIALGWRASWGTWLPGLAAAGVFFVAHLAGIWIVEGRLQDDSVGIAAMVAGAALGGWLLGRGLHALIRRALEKSQPSSRP